MCSECTAPRRSRSQTWFPGALVLVISETLVTLEFVPGKDEKWFVLPSNFVVIFLEDDNIVQAADHMTWTQHHAPL